MKETGVDDQSLAEFHTHYFGRNPLYKDGAWKIYKAMGGRKITAYKLMAGLARSLRRHKKKNIKTRMGDGDGWMQGGVLIFDRQGELIYAYEENYGFELNMEQIEAIVKSACDEVSAVQEPSVELSNASVSTSS